jgi:hypothetical protein
MIVRAQGALLKAGQVSVPSPSAGLHCRATADFCSLQPIEKRFFVMRITS